MKIKDKKKSPSNQMPYPLHYMSLTDNSEWIFGTYKLNGYIMFFLFLFFIEPFLLMVPKLHLSTQQITVA